MKELSNYDTSRIQTYSCLLYTSKRRGQVEGMESSRSGARIVKAMVPLAEMFGYVTALRTITSGRATSSIVYSHHAQVSNSIAKAVLEEVKGRADLI